MEQGDKIVLNIYILPTHSKDSSNYRSYDQHGSDAILSHPILRPKPDAHRMCAQDQDFTHTTRILVNQIKLVS
jgi:hypothetical protein